MFGLLLEHRRGVGRNAALDESGEELVREAAAGHPVQRLIPIVPVVEQRQSVAAFDAVDGVAATQLGGDLESAGEHHAVHLVLDPVGDDALLGQPLHALGLRDVDQPHVGQIERRQIGLARRRTLAHEPVVRLEGLGGLRIVHQIIDAATQPLHDLVVLLLPDRHDLFQAQGRRVLRAGDPRGHVAAQLGPEVADQIRLPEHHPDKR